jgi:peptidoglycan/LPS O-acetylase OafA/YrhL
LVLLAPRGREFVCWSGSERTPTAHTARERILLVKEVLASIFAPLRGGAGAAVRRAPMPAARAAVAPAAGGEFYIPSLDGIRAVSFLIVFVAHAGLDGLVPGGFGVTVFFFLSGYLITTLLRREYARHGAISYQNFYIRRILRIFPPYYLVLSVATLLTLAGVLRGELAPGPVAAQLAYCYNYFVAFAGWDGVARGTGIYWSLAVEEHFYLVFPFVYALLQRSVPSRRGQFALLLAACAAVLAWRCVLVSLLGAADERTYVATDTRIDSILFGCALAVLGNPVLDRPGAPAPRWVLAAVPLALAALLVSFAYRDAQFRETFRYTLQGLALMPLFIVAIRYPSAPPFALLNVRWVRFLGVLSYSLYLVHQVYLFALGEWLGWHPLPQGALALALAIATAAALYYAVERPCARLRRRLLAAVA